ncbi:conserved hypothetical protein [Leishmania mexicana MHOM/GT/2001/U1103]|uniref:Uncharacterized protein n=1 Tax=Leishmania mexicana (strain MHOM/GT/2001/U1103) TaxID=929439 RepID=E9B5U8_LEIMU|nr:conserved hypothetical protein [Leishmania mexicana MHOM/GT/2001/U1103]CBZ30619.1 conserved hypothetical protein [Leishmania mexicana MHOM/GT/2001/U1103]
MPAKKLSPATKASSTATHPPRRRPSGLLGSSTNGSEQRGSAASLPFAATVAAQPLKRSGMKSRNSIGHTSFSAQQAVAVTSSGDAHPPHVSTQMPAATAKASSGRPRGVAAIPANHTAPPPPAAREFMPSPPPPAAAAAVQNAPPLGSSSATMIAGDFRRARFGISTASASAPSATVDPPGASPAAPNVIPKTSLPTLSTGPPSLPTAKRATHHADVDTNRTPVPPASAGSWAAKPQARYNLPASGPRRLSSSSSNAVKATSNVSAAAATPSTSAPETAAAEADLREAPAARQPASALLAVASKPNGQSKSAADPSTDSTAAPGTSLSSVAQASLKSRTPSLSVIGKKKVMRRASIGTATSRPPSAATSRRPSVGCIATADNTAAPTRDSSVLYPRPQSSCSVAPTLDAESAPSTTLNTARTTGPMAVKTPTNAGSAVSAGTATPLPRGPVVSEEWARSIIKPGDENLLYRATPAATTYSGFACTPSGISMSGSAASATRQASTVRSSIKDTQLRHAQETVLRLRNAETPTPGWRSTKAASVGAGSAVSVASGGSGSRFGSTVKRSGTRLQRRRQEDEDRQRSLMETMAIPAGENGGSMNGGRVSHPGTAAGSASPTPSRISEASTNTMMRGGGRLSGGSARPLLEQLPGGASVPVDIMGQRRSPSLKLFAKPSPRTFSTPSPRGSAGAPGLNTTFGVSNGPYYAGKEELTRLTWVREEMLRALMQSAVPPAASAVTEENSAAAAAVSSMPNTNDGSDANALEGSASSVLTMHVDPQAGEMVPVSPTFSSAGKRPRQRVYSVDLRSGASSDESAPPKQSPAADVTQQRGRLAGSGTTPILASSIRQKPGRSVSISRPAQPGSPVGIGATPGPTSARPTLDSSAFASGAPPAASAAAARQQRRAAVTVAMCSLQSPSTVAERVRLELVRQEQQQPAAVRTGQMRAAAPSSVPAASQRPTATPIDAATRLLLLDPLFPLISEENYQRLVLQNDEYTARKALLARIGATPPPQSSASRPYESPPPVPPLDVDKKPHRSGAEVPPAARALEMDLAEADEAAPWRSLTSTSTAAAAPPPSPSASPPNAAAIGSTPPRRPSVQYGGPALYATFSPSRVPSPSPTASGLTSPTAGPAVGLGSATSTARDGKLLVNVVMPSEKSGSIKSLPAGGVWYAPSPMSEFAGQSTAQPSLNASLLVSVSGSGAVGGTGNSPIRMRSTSPTASCSSSRNATRRGSLLRSVQQHLQPQATTAATPSRSDSAGDEVSTASDETVDMAEVELCKTLPRWGPFRTSHAAAPSDFNVVQQACAATATAPRKTKKSAHGEKSPVVSPTESTSSPLSMASALSLAMAEELQAYVHVFLKRYRNVDAVTAKEMGPVPETPLTLQHAIRRSLRLSTGYSANAADDKDAVELEDPLDDGSYHSQNVQYVLDLLGSLLQVETSFCEDDAAHAASGAHPLTAAAQRHTKKRVTGAQLIAAVMGRSTSPSGEDTADGAAPKHTRNAAARSAAVRPVLKLHDPELRAVELMFVNDAP